MAPGIVRVFQASVSGDLAGFGGTAASEALTTRFLSRFFFCFWRAMSVSFQFDGNKKPTRLGHGGTKSSAVQG
jgi:hypothetical protein